MAKEKIYLLFWLFESRTQMSKTKSQIILCEIKDFF